MATYVSPGVYVTEKDWSDYTPSLNATTVGVVGFASQGPVGIPTLCTTQDQLLNVFGDPSEATGGYGLLGSYHILERTNTLFFTRAALDSAVRAEIEVVVGTCPRAQIVGLNPAYSYLVAVTVLDGAGNNKTADAPLWVQTTPANDDASLSVLSSTAEALADAAAKITDSTSPYTILEGANTSAIELVGTYAGAGAKVGLTLWETSGTLPTIPAGTTLAGVSAYSGTNAVLSATGISDVVGGALSALSYNGVVAAGVAALYTGQSSGTDIVASAVSGGSYFHRSLYPGEGYNYSSTVPQYGVKNTGLQISVASVQGANQGWTLLRNGGIEETFPVNLINNLAASANGLDPERFVNSTTDETNKTSNYILAEFGVATSAVGASPVDALWTLPTIFGGSPVQNGSTKINVLDNSGVATSVSSTIVKYVKLKDGVYNLTSGLNGDMAGGKSFSDADVKAAIMGTAALQNGVQSFLKEDIDVNMVAIPGCTDQSIVNDLITNAETSQKFLAITNPPQNLGSAQEAIRWSSGKASGRTASLNSSYGAVYWPWVKLYNPFSLQDEYVSPDIFAVRQMCYTDMVGEPWFAPAGLTRGRLTRPVDVEMVLSQGDRDALYGPGNIINPITKFSTDGIVIWGQRTAQRTATALDRVNVRRLMILVRKTILASTRRFVFEPNDPATWSRVTNAVAPFLSDIQNRRGITKFKVICDESTNTPLRIDRNELWCKVILQPTKAAEILVFELNLTSASLGLDVPSA